MISLLRTIPGQLGIRWRRMFYSRYWGHRDFVIHENVLITGFEKNMTVGHGFRVNPDVKIFCSEGRFTVGEQVFINCNCFISADRSEVLIGNDCLLANGVTIWCSNHSFKIPDKIIRAQKKSHANRGCRKRRMDRSTGNHFTRRNYWRRSCNRGWLRCY